MSLEEEYVKDGLALYGHNNVSEAAMCNGTDVWVMNTSVWEFVRLYRGPQRLPLEMTIPLTVINVIIFVTGLLGNAAVCLVIFKHSSMHTATNYYLFNLAISDLTLLIFGLPNDVTVYWHQYPWVFGEAFCKIRALLSEMSSYVSVLTIVAFSTERCLSICYPLYLYTMSGLQRAIRIITCLWLISLIGALPFSVYVQVYYLDHPNCTSRILKESAFCGMLDPPPLLSELSTLIFFIIPMLVIMVQYTMMGMKIWNRTQAFGQNVRGSVHRDRKSQSHKAIIRMLGAVVFCFFICWAPFHAQRLLYIYAQDTQYYHQLNEWMFYITGILYYLSSTLNPILYNVMSNRYRTAFREVLCGSRRRDLDNRNSTIRTRVPSHCSNSDKAERNNRYDQTVDDDDTTTLVENRDLVVVSSPKGKNTLIYQVNYSEIKPNSETCI